MHGELNDGTKGKCGTSKQTNEYEKDLKLNEDEEEEKKEKIERERNIASKFKLT